MRENGEIPPFFLSVFASSCSYMTCSVLIVMATSCWQLASSRTEHSVAVGSKLCQGNTMKKLITVGMHTAVRSFVGDALQQPVSQQLMMHRKVIRLPRSCFSPPSCLRPHRMWKNYGHTLVSVCWGSRSALVEARCHKGGAPDEVRPRLDRILLGSKGSVLIGNSGGLRRTFGGQSVVPWELALFLVEEMKGEGVEPGAVVYTAALAECRWAGEQEHVRYLNREMDARGLQIVKGIPGAVDNDPPPSQSPPLYGKFPTLPPGYSGDCSDVKSNGGSLLQVATATKMADTALATIEAMWARGKHDPSPATCRAALDACASGGQWERALSLVRDSAMTMAAHTEGVGIESRQVPEKPDLPARVERLALEGRWAEALSMVQEGAE